MSPHAEDLTSPAGALSAALDAICEASAEDEPWRRWQFARTAADYAAEAWWHPSSSADQRADASRYLKLALDMDEDTKARHDRMRARMGLRPPVEP
ncbi:hypothetical protein [Mycobacterium sp. NPDC006124]|uniref:hypothetical protein n=1 Tax=Mycobacterium sp. NPDC006124 TaxID=3156729 RepID=UPI0033A5663D